MPSEDRMTDNAVAPIAGKIRIANQQFMKAFEDGDAARVASLYGGEALLFPPGTEITEGVDAITRFWRGAMDMGITGVMLETISLETIDAMAIEVGNYSLMAGTEAVDKGKYLVIWRLEAGQWKLYRDIWNTNNRGA